MMALEFICENALSIQILSENLATGYCRTCLAKFLGNTGHDEIDFIEISSNKQIENMLDKYVALEDDVDLTKYKNCPKNVCIKCCTIMNTFEKFRKKAIENAKNLYNILSSPNNKTDDMLSLSDEEQLQLQMKNETVDVEQSDVDSKHSEEILQEESFVDMLDPSTGCMDNEDYELQNTENIVVEYLEDEESATKEILDYAQEHIEIQILYNKDDSELDNNSNKGPYKCEQCQKKFYRQETYMGHIKQIHKGIELPYQCRICNKNWKNFTSLMQHTTRYHPKNPNTVYECLACDENFQTEYLWQNHYNLKHIPDEDKSRTLCSLCGMMFCSKASLKSHIKNMHKQRELVKCPQCPQLFRSIYSLKSHQIRHTNLKPFQCEQCGMKFSRKDPLTRHRKTHLPYEDRMQCDYDGCKVRFYQNSAKLKHIRTVHFKIKDHNCDICGKFFCSLKSLKRHHRIHAREK